jgi:hypothetical protein
MKNTSMLLAVFVGVATYVQETSWLRFEAQNFDGGGQTIRFSELKSTSPFLSQRMATM